MNTERIDNDMSDSYEGLPALSWDAFGGNEPGSEEFVFFRDRLKEAGGRCLDLTCGSGKFLVPYRREGICVDGVDSSPTMIANCRRRLEQEGLSANLYCQRMQELDLPEKYDTIFITVGSFVVLTSFDDALETLRRCFNHLRDGGHLYVTLFLPAEVRDPAAQTGYSRAEPAKLEDGSTVEIERWTESVDYLEQVVVQKRRYIQRRNGTVIKQELHLSAMRWYGKQEFIMMLEKVGFSTIRLFGNYCDEAPTEWGMIVFGARRDTKDGTKLSREGRLSTTGVSDDRYSRQF
jgi:SAM-dependent methyltransferase